MYQMSATQVAQSVDHCGDEKIYPSGCAFSPDGLCILTTTAAVNSHHETTTEDAANLRLYNTMFDDNNNNDEEKSVKEWKCALRARGGNAVRSFHWYPHMRSNDPGTCCFLAAARNQPVHLFDAYTGHVRASYSPFNALDELESPTVAQFHPHGQTLVAAGFRTDRTLHVFATSRPGRHSTLLRLGKTRRSPDGQKGLVSAVDYVRDGLYLAVGTYAPGSIYVYDERSGSAPTGTILNGICVVGQSLLRHKKRFITAPINKNSSSKQQKKSSNDRTGQNTGKHQDNDNTGDKEVEEDDDQSDLWFSSAKSKWYHSRAQTGVTQLLFSPTEHYLLYSTSRRSNAVLTWDLRSLSGLSDYQLQPIGGIQSFATNNETNQRLQFDIDSSGQTIFIGGLDNCVRIYDVQSGQRLGVISDLEDAVNGVSCCPTSTEGNTSHAQHIALAVGSRHFPSDQDIDSNECILLPNQCQENHDTGLLKLYKYSRQQQQQQQQQ